MKKIVLSLILSMASFVFAFGQTNDNYATNLKEMFKVSGAEESFHAVIKQMLGMLREQSPNVDPNVWEAIEKEFSSTSIDDLVEMQVSVYKKYLSDGDIEEIIKFYQSPVGQKYAKNTPLIMQESIQIGQQWGIQIGEKINKRLKELGYAI